MRHRVRGTSIRHPRTRHGQRQQESAMDELREHGFKSVRRRKRLPTTVRDSYSPPKKSCARKDRTYYARRRRN